MEKRTLGLVFITLIYLHFFGINALNFSGRGILLFIILCFFSVSSVIKYKQLMFGRGILFIAIGLSISIISCFIFRHQPIIKTIGASSGIYFLFFYFFMNTRQYTIQQVEKCILMLAILFSVCYIAQYILYPTPIFAGALDELNNSVEQKRIRMNGSVLAALGALQCLNKYFVFKNKYCLLLLLFFLIPLVMMGFRTMLVGISICILGLLLKYNGFSKKTIKYGLLIFLLMILFTQTDLFQNVWSNMMERNEEGGNFNNEDYIRWKQLAYFTTSHFKNNFEFFLGSGLPASGSKYGDFMGWIGEETLISWVDWGIVGLSWMIGIPAVIGMIGYSIKAAFIKLPPEYYYLNFFFIYLLLVSVTTLEFCRGGSFIIQTMVLYLITKIHSGNETKNRIADLS